MRSDLLVLVGLQEIVLLSALANSSPADARHPSDWLADAFQRAPIVCLTDTLQFLPAAEPTVTNPRTSSYYVARVTHVWKGEPPDTLKMHTGGGRSYNADGLDTRWITTSCSWGFDVPPSELVRGRRHVVFGEKRLDGTFGISGFTNELAHSQAQLLWLRMNAGPARPMTETEGRPGPPDVSFRQLGFDLEHADSTASTLAAQALLALGDSSGTILPRLERLLQSGVSSSHRSEAGRVLGRWSFFDRGARLAILRALDRGGVETQLSVIASCRSQQDDWLEQRVFEHRSSRSEVVRAAVLERCAQLLSAPYPPVRAYCEALRDPAPRVRLAAVHALQNADRRIDEVSSALAPLLEDPDVDVARAAQRARVYLSERRR